MLQRVVLSIETMSNSPEGFQEFLSIPEDQLDADNEDHEPMFDINEYISSDRVQMIESFCENRLRN